MTERRSNVRATSALLVAFSLWGASFLFAKVALRELPVSQVVLYRFALASLVLVPMLWWHRTWPRRVDLPFFVLTGALTVPITFLLQFNGLARTSVSSAALIIGMLPPLLAVTAALISQERLNGRGWTAIGLSVSGMVLLAGSPGTRQDWLGDGLVLLSLLAVVAWTLLSKRLLARYPPLDATAHILSWGTLTLAPISVVLDGPPRILVSARAGLAVLALGLLCTALTFVLYNWGLQSLPASRAGVYANLEPLTGALLGIVLLHDPLRPGLLLGGTLILMGAGLVSWPGKQGRVAPMKENAGRLLSRQGAHRPGQAFPDRPRGRV